MLGFRDPIDGQLGHVIGVSDISSLQESWRPPPAVSTHEMPDLSTSNLGHPSRALGPASARSSSSWGDEASDVVMPLANTASRRQQPEVRVSFDPLTADLTILDCSTAFTFLCGLHPEGSGLLPWIKEGDRFFEWVEFHVNSYLNTLSPPSQRTFNITLRTAVSDAIGFEFRAVCSLTVEDAAVHPAGGEEDGEDEEEEEETVVASALLSRVQRRTVRAR
eukprot:gnl/TRDRNA2_/TRDRNA2_176603_c1_seq10.p1 gnl/TRDRNA2_/TRDRNA2_176603_c1~~gnl/TRDRNA2_/TRDRNA2_176603_c1_seq10.p1  ORF type:complete len:220 (+),score=14.21 gnl/TRDRNA2_/TRDRNA2_176603_c1_seq10:353-1012(+)